MLSNLKKLYLFTSFLALDVTNTIFKNIFIKIIITKHFMEI